MVDIRLSCFGWLSGETELCRSEEGEPRDGRYQTVVFRVVVFFLCACAEAVCRICLRSGHLLSSCCVGAFPVQWLLVYILLSEYKTKCNNS